jgi:hypothetical protein
MTIREIIPKEMLELHQLESDRLVRELKKLQGTWVDRNPIMRRLAIWYYERKFLKSIKKLTHALKHS